MLRDALRRAASAMLAFGLAVGALAATNALTGCGRDAPPPPPDPAKLEALRPADVALAAKYERSCALCHARPGSGAPLVGDASAWAPRLAQGADVLATHVAQGLGGMPPHGLCADCTDADVRALIAFLSTGESKKKA